MNIANINPVTKDESLETYLRIFLEKKKVDEGVIEGLMDDMKLLDAQNRITLLEENIRGKEIQIETAGQFIQTLQISLQALIQANIGGNVTPTSPTSSGKFLSHLLKKKLLIKS